MIVTVESKARPCPGVERAVAMAENILRRDETLYSIGQLIHNRREVERLGHMGLRVMKPESLDELLKKNEFNGEYFLIRTHGETVDILEKVQESTIHIVDATCPIVRHSQKLVDQHVSEGWGIIIAGDKKHAEVRGLLDRTKGCGVVISNIEEVKHLEFEHRSLLLAQTTIDSRFFSEVRIHLSKKLSDLKIVDTTCRFIRNRQDDVRAFSAEQDVFIIVGGDNSANCRLLYDSAVEINPRSYRLEEPRDIDKNWLMNCVSVGISGGASTPRWQLKEIQSHITNYENEKNPKGLANRKGGNFLWWTRKNHKTKK